MQRLIGSTPGQEEQVQWPPGECHAIWAGTLVMPASSASFPSSELVIGFRFSSCAKNSRPVILQSFRNISGGNQCATGRRVWNSIGNHRLGVVTKTPTRATRQASPRKAVCCFPAAYVFQNCARMDVVELAIGKRKLLAVGAYEFQSRKLRFKKRSIVNSACSYPNLGLDTTAPDNWSDCKSHSSSLRDSVPSLLTHLRHGEESLIHSSSLISGNTNRKRSWRG